MKFAVKSIVAAAACSAGLANAAPINLSVGESITSMGWQAGELSGTVNWTFSSSFTDILNSGSVRVVSSITPAVVTTIPKPFRRYKAISVAAPIRSLSGTFKDTTVSISDIKTIGGTHLAAQADDFTTIGGHLDITNLSFDLGAKKSMPT